MPRKKPQITEDQEKFIRLYDGKYSRSYLLKRINAQNRRRKKPQLTLRSFYALVHDMEVDKWECEYWGLGQISEITGYSRSTIQYWVDRKFLKANFFNEEGKRPKVSVRVKDFKRFLIDNPVVLRNCDRVNLLFLWDEPRLNKIEKDLDELDENQLPRSIIEKIKIYCPEKKAYFNSIKEAYIGTGLNNYYQNSSIYSKLNRQKEGVAMFNDSITLMKVFDNG